MPTISVIVPIYNVEPYLHRCVDSILAQTFADFELILVDDGSPDNCGAICDEYATKDGRVRVIHKENGGLSSARNAGIEAATGEFILFVDADDMIHRQSVAIELQLLREKDADAVVCSFERFRDIRDIDSLSPPKSGEISVITGLEAEKGFFNNPSAAKYVSSCGKVYRKELFDGIRFPEGRLFEDEFTTYKLYYQCDRIVVTDTVLYYYYVNDSGITRNLTFNKRFDEYDAQVERIQFYRGNECKDLYHLALLEFLRTAQWDLIAYQRNKPEGVDEERGNNFQRQYRQMMREAMKERIVSFGKNYDYYVLAFPEKRNVLRVGRLVRKLLGKN